jgi:NDP-sugar pyrophosphorylase family protein
MIGFILAAGFGTRLRPLTEHVPKAMVTVCGIPLLARQLYRWSQAGLGPIGVNTHYLSDQLELLQQHSEIPFTLFSETGTIRGTGGALHFARDFLRRDETFCIGNVDIVTTFDLRPFIKKFTESDLHCALLAIPDPDKGTILHNRQSGMYEGVGVDRQFFPDSIGADFIGIAMYRRSFLNLLEQDDFSIVPVWRRAVDNGYSVGVMLVPDSYWCDIGTPGALAQVHFDAIKGLYQPSIPEHLVVDRTNYRCFPSALPEKSQEKIGRNAWVETEELSDKCTITNSVVMAGAKCNDIEGAIKSKIITQWGEMSFG